MARGVYAVVPAGAAPACFQPDPFLVVAAPRAYAISAHHAAFELLGVAHSVWMAVPSAASPSPWER